MYDDIDWFRERLSVTWLKRQLRAMIKATLQDRGILRLRRGYLTIMVNTLAENWRDILSIWHPQQNVEDGFWSIIEFFVDTGLIGSDIREYDFPVLVNYARRVRPPVTYGVHTDLELEGS